MATTTEVKKEEKKTLDVTKKQDVGYCIPLWLRDIQIKLAIERVKGRIQPHYEDRTDPVAVVCFGPSLNDTWEQLKDFKFIISCSGSHKFLIEHGIIPNWHVEVDPREHKVQLIGPPHKDVEYLIASTCHPKVFDHLEGYNVKLWHVFDGEADALRTLPPGEWSLFGGSSVGLRALTIARFLGFKDLHVFGMDGNQGKSGKHADKHPNQPKDHQICEYGGETFETTPSMAECARQTFHELDQMPDVKATFYGHGLVQAMAKDYKPNYVPKGTPTVGFVKPDLISPEMRELNAKLHQTNPAYGVGGQKRAETVLKLCESIKAKSILDYGCGKGLLAKNLPFPIWEYDPAIPGKEESPKPADLVVCTDVLEHIEPDKLGPVLEDLRRCVKTMGYFVINTKAAGKTYADGRNTHLIQQGEEWWKKQISKYFTIASVENKALPELHFLVSPKIKGAPEKEEETISVGEVKFYTPNNSTKWRAQTLLTKEPITIDWINRMTKGEVLFDIGANVGGYTVWAGVKGIDVYAFEPEAENYALLVRNMNLNKIEPKAYCLAIGDSQKFGILNLSQSGVGGSCHTFGEAIDKRPHQGCLSISLDALMRAGFPVPDHIKIDVDGLEPLVIAGGKELLKKGVKSILVEIDVSKEDHRNMVDTLTGLGFYFDVDQVEKSTRQDGPFKGCAEYLFKRKEKKIQEEWLEHLLNKVSQAEIINDPTPHLYITDAFPAEFYEEIQRKIPKKFDEISKVRASTRGYSKRLIGEKTNFWNEIDFGLRRGEFKNALCNKFGVDPSNLTDETVFIRDIQGYQIGPHTDSPVKVITALFYLPSDATQLTAGTSLYVPNQDGFTCEGGPHHQFEDFTEVSRLPYVPNSLFIFLKTNTSFHGVAPYTGEKPRDVLLYDVRKLA